MTKVMELTSNPKYQFEDLKIMIMEVGEKDEVLAFIGKYSDPENHFGQGLKDMNNLIRNKDCPSVSKRNPCKRPDNYVLCGTKIVENIGYVLMVEIEHLDIRKDENFKKKVAPYGF